MNLTEHFTLEELTRTDHRSLDNTPNDSEIANLTRLALFLERVRKALGSQPIMITSAFRSQEVNAAVGSKSTSQHRLGCAADFRVPGMPPNEVVAAVIGSGLPYDQIICEFDSWTHISIPSLPTLFARRQALTIDKAGTHPYAR